ncbi:MAG: hypothetical protein IPO21_21620 [Bacteroidales bacterium]|nr:hypothetical protein [Bacteroidales bacterium]
MQTLVIDSSIGTSKILVGESFKNVSTYLPKKKLAIITDDTIFDLYGKDFPEANIIIKNKTR